MGWATGSAPAPCPPPWHLPAAAGSLTPLCYLLPITTWALHCLSDTTRSQRARDGMSSFSPADVDINTQARPPWGEASARARAHTPSTASAIARSPFPLGGRLKNDGISPKGHFFLYFSAAEPARPVLCAQRGASHG